MYILIKCYLELFASISDPENWITNVTLVALAIWDILETQIFVTSSVKMFTLKWRKENERATSSFRFISEAI